MDDFIEAKKEILDVTRDYVNDIVSIWNRIFHQKMCKENLQKLKVHAQNFYKDLIAESLEKQEFIQKEIDELKEEACSLKRLLKIDITLPNYDHTKTPLLIIQTEIDRCLIDLRERLQQRKNQICDLLLEQELLCEELGETPRPLLDDPLPTEGEVCEFHKYLEQLKELRDERMIKLSTLRREIKKFLVILDFDINTDTDNRLLNDREILLNKETFDGLEKMYQQFGAQVEEVREKIDDMRNKVEQLWCRLDVSPNTRKRVSRCTEYNQRTYDVFYAELQRCEILKSQNIEYFVKEIRKEIVEWWDKTLKSDLQRSRFTNFTSDIYTDDLLMLHEMELEDIKNFYKTNEQIFDLFAERKKLWDRMTALITKSTDPGRYANRGGQLLKEEKERKIISKQLPEIEKKLVESVSEFEERENQSFLVFGENIRKVIDDDWNKAKTIKTGQGSARKTVKTPIIRTPMSARNVTTMSARRGPLTNTFSSIALSTSKKRKLKVTAETLPDAKRNLIKSFNKANVFLKPSNAETGIAGVNGEAGGTGTGVATTTGSSMAAPKRGISSNLKKVIATTIRRNSGRKSGIFKKRRSAGKHLKPSDPPNIVISEWTTDEENYEDFERKIEPDSRSSTVLQNPSAVGPTLTRDGRMKHHKEQRNSEKRRHLPDPRMLRTPSKLNLRDNTAISVVRSPGAINVTTNNRKLTTKNLPIII